MEPKLYIFTQTIRSSGGGLVVTAPDERTARVRMAARSSSYEPETEVFSEPVEDDFMIEFHGRR